MHEKIITDIYIPKANLYKHFYTVVIGTQSRGSTLECVIVFEKDLLVAA